jgi:hypothetical protein
MVLLAVKLVLVVLPALFLEVLEITLIATGGLGLIDTSDANRAHFENSVIDHEYI